MDGKGGLLNSVVGRKDTSFSLERPVIAPDSAIVSEYLEGRKVLVTGAGGYRF
jgi:FlaA1/EpsC-like NDP-sugar epimerase